MQYIYRWKKYFLILLIIFLTSITLFYIIKYYKTAYDKSNLTFTPNDDKILLYNTYYENNESAFFYSNNLGDILYNNLNLYSINWLLNISSLTGTTISSTVKDNLKIIFSDLKKIESTDIYQNIYADTLIKTNIEKQLFGEVKNKNYYMSRIKNKVDKSGLFYYENENEDIIKKIQATNLALEIFNLIDDIPIDTKALENKLIELYHDDNNFTLDGQIKKNTIDLGIVLVNNLRLLDRFTKSDLKLVIQYRKEWLMKWYKNLNNYAKSDDINIFLLNQAYCSFYDTFNYLDISFDLNIDFHKYYGNDSNLLQMIKTNYFIEPHIVYEIINIHHLSNKNIPQEVITFINSNSDFWYYKTCPDSNIKDFYYGLNLANIYKLKYNKEKLLNYVNNNYDNENDIFNLYFLSKIYSELNLNINKQITLDKFYDNLKEYKLNMDNPEETYYVIELSKLLNINLDNINFIKQISKETLETLITKSKSDRQLYYIFKMSKSLNIDIDASLLTNKVENYFSDKDGAYFSDNDTPIVTVYSTYRMLDILYTIKSPILKEKKDKVLLFINSIKGEKGGYFINSNSNSSHQQNYELNFTLEGMYNCYCIKKIVSK